MGVEIILRTEQHLHVAAADLQYDQVALAQSLGFSQQPVCLALRFVGMVAGKDGENPVASFEIDKAFSAMLRIDPRAEHSGGQRFQHCLDPRIIEFP